MLQNKDIETLRMLFSSHNYVMTTAELTASKLYYADIKQLLDEGLIERVRRGYYHWTQDYGESEVVIINRLFPDAVLCMETALFYYRYSDRNPAEWNFAIDKNVSKRRTKIDYPFIKAYRVESELVTLGETEGEIDFHKVRIYDRDRTICDVLRNMNKMDKEVFNKAVQGYVKDPKKNIPNPPIRTSDATDDNMSILEIACKRIDWSVVVMADVAASVLAKLRNKAKASGISYQQCLQLFVQEEFLRKLSKSGCEDTLILKGGLFIYTLTNFESRATIDVDFLLRGYSNSIDDVKELICKIIDTPTGNDYIEMRAKGFEEISPQRKYHGISTQIIAQIKNVRVPFNVDIGVGDIIVPRAEERTINTQLPDFEAPVIKTYSLESTIAEKFDAILQRFELTGRMKDFYDIYYLSRTFDFDGAKLQSAIFETLQRRGTPYDRDSFKRVVALADDEDMQKRWKFFLKTIKDNTLEFPFVIEEIQTFLEPVFDAIVNENEWQEQWNFIMKWNKNERSPKL